MPGTPVVAEPETLNISFGLLPDIGPTRTLVSIEPVLFSDDVVLEIGLFPL